MSMSPGIRKLALLAHVASSLGWLGAIAVFLALALVGRSSADRELSRAATVVLSLTTWWVIIPCAGLSLLTGIVSALGTRWGLFRYYWVVLKLVLTVIATGMLLLHTVPIDSVAHAARLAPGTVALSSTLLQLIVAATGGALVVLVLTALSVYKPRGMTRYGQRTQDAHQGSAPGREPMT